LTLVLSLILALSCSDNKDDETNVNIDGVWQGISFTSNGETQLFPIVNPGSTYYTFMEYKNGNSRQYQKWIETSGTSVTYCTADDSKYEVNGNELTVPGSGGGKTIASIVLSGNSLIVENTISKQVFIKATSDDITGAVEECHK
jgi:hypothetical protein